jgi:hypothetical protein
VLHWGGRGGFGGFCLLLEGEEGVGWFEGFTLFGTSNNFKGLNFFFLWLYQREVCERRWNKKQRRIIRHYRVYHHLYLTSSLCATVSLNSFDILGFF